MNSYTSYRNPSVPGHLHRYDLNHLRSIRSAVARGVPYDLRKVLGVIHDEDVTKHLEIGEIRRDALNLAIVLSCQFSEVGNHSGCTFNPAMNAW